VTSETQRVIYLAVALLSLATYVQALWGLHRNPPHEQALAYHGLVRTALSRVAVGLTYSVIGVLLVLGKAPTGLGLWGFIAAGCVWITNARLDVRLKRHLDQKGSS